MKNTGLTCASWRKSSYSFSNGNCVEVAGAAPAVAVRDSQDRDGPRLAFSSQQWSAFAAAVKATHSAAGTSLGPG
jgi:Domain of unknown function (DUF397)